MALFLIDANLPYYFGLWNNDKFIHLKDINDSWSDELVWQYARENALIIVTKDADFSTKVLYKGAPPKVIHLKTGNLKIKDFHSLINKIWPDIENLILENNLINIYLDRIEIIK
jgi:predicted nuclease of predicted toxin-antitoxin system